MNLIYSIVPKLIIAVSSIFPPGEIKLKMIKVERKALLYHIGGGPYGGGASPIKKKLI